MGCVIQGLPLRRPKEGWYNNDTIQDLSAVAGSRCYLLGIVQDASLHPAQALGALAPMHK